MVLLVTSMGRRVLVRRLCSTATMTILLPRWLNCSTSQTSTWITWTDPHFIGICGIIRHCSLNLDLLKMGHFWSCPSMNTPTYSLITTLRVMLGIIGSMLHMMEKDWSSCLEGRRCMLGNWRRCLSCRHIGPRLCCQILIIGLVMSMICSVFGCSRMPIGVIWFKNTLGSFWRDFMEIREMVYLETTIMPQCQLGWCLPLLASTLCLEHKNTFSAAH